MKPVELVQVVEASGGVLSVSDGRLHVEVPDQSAHLLPDLRTQRHEVAQVLQQRLADALRRWMDGECVATRLCSSSLKFLHREFGAWSRIQCGRDAFGAALVACGFGLAEDGMVEGLALRRDVGAALDYERERRI